MKKLVFSIISLAFAGFFANAQQPFVVIGGQVTALETGMPVEGHVVYAMFSDSLGYYAFTTDSDGQYGDTLYFNTFPPSTVTVYTYDCLFNIHEVTVEDLSEPVIVDFAICTEIIPPDCQAWFYYYPTDSMNTLMTYQFIDASSGIHDSWQWDFGDGTYSTEQNPLHSYSMEGTYVVCLAIWDNAGQCQSTFCEEVWVGVIPPPTGCENYFTFYTEDGETFFFSGSVNTTNPVSYYWDFGDGFYGEGQNVTHTFTMNPNGFNVFDVCLATFTTGPDGDSCFDISCQEVWLEVWPPFDCYNFFNYNLEDSLTVTFSGEAYWGNMLTGAVIWEWNFGDGDTGEGQTVTHVYPAGGQEFYTVCLRTVSVDSLTGETCEYTSCMDVWLKNWIGCENYFYYEPAGENTFTFYGEAYWGGMIIPADEYLWDFGDGTTGQGQMITHTFVPGDPLSYTVCLTTYTMDPTTYDSCIAVSCQEVFTGGGNDFYTLFGQVIMNNSFADVAQVTLYITLPDGTMTPVGVMPVDSAGHYAFYQLMPGNYYLMAELLPGSAEYGNFIPTYYENAMSWTEADMITLGEPVNPYNIYLIPANAYASGTGGINGSINVDYGLFRDGEPASQVEILLMNHNDQPIRYIYSDEQGHFDFSTLDWGTYKVHAEVPGKVTLPAVVVLDDLNPEITVDFTVTQSEVYNTLSAGKAENPVFEVGNLLPNPFVDLASLPVTLREASTIHIEIYNQLGQQVFSSRDEYTAGSHLIPLDLGMLGKGIYLMNVSTDPAHTVVRKIVK